MKTEKFTPRIGTQTIGSSYWFTEQGPIIESAKGMLELGSDSIKIAACLKTPEEVISRLCEPELTVVFDMPFAFYHIWINPVDYALAENNQVILKQNYDLIYRAACHLLKHYENTGKTFLLGNWEGDWLVLKNYDFNSAGDMDVINGFLACMKVRQQAVEDARRDLNAQNVRVAHYVEVNRVFDAKDFGYNRLVNCVLPNVAVDMVSYSAYDSLWPVRITEALCYIEKCAKFTGYFDGVFAKKVYIGEFDVYHDGIKFGYCNTTDQIKNFKCVITSALAFGAPFAIHWEYYNNERSGKFCLVDAHGYKNEIHRWLKECNVRLKMFDLLYFWLVGEMPSVQYYAQMAASLFLPARSAWFRKLFDADYETCNLPGSLREETSARAIFDKIAAQTGLDSEYEGDEAAPLFLAVLQAIDKDSASIGESAFAEKYLPERFITPKKVFDAPLSTFDIFNQYLDSYSFGESVLRAAPGDCPFFR